MDMLVVRSNHQNYMVCNNPCNNQNKAYSTILTVYQCRDLTHKHVRNQPTNLMLTRSSDTSSDACAFIG